MPIPTPSHALRLGILGCGADTHGLMWAEMLAAPEYRHFGLIPTKLWDADPEAASSLAARVGAHATVTPVSAGDDVDGVLITEPYPERYLELARPFLQAGKRIFINRPLAGNLADARELLRLARTHGASLYSASSLYHAQASQRIREALEQIAPLRFFNVTGPTPMVDWYAPHLIACVIGTLGTGIDSVRALSLERDPLDAHRLRRPALLEVRYGERSTHAGATGVLALTGPNCDWYGFRLKLIGKDRESPEFAFDVGYEVLFAEMARFFETGIEPVAPEIMWEQTAVYYALMASARNGGASMPVPALTDIQEY